MFKAVSNPKKLQELLRKGGNPNETNKSKGTVLFAAIEAGETESVDMLIKAGAKLDARDKLSCTPLIFAVKNGAPEEIVELLLSREALALSDEGGYNALHWAAKLGEESTTAKLLKFITNEQDKARFLTTSCDAKLSVVQVAIASNCSTEFLQLLLDRGCDLETRNAAGLTALLFAATTAHHTSIIPFLVQNKADVFAVSNKKENVLHLCASANEELPEISNDVIQKLVNETDDDGNTVGHALAAKGDDITLDTLEKKFGWNRAAKNKAGKTADDLLKEFQKEEEAEVQQEILKLKQKELQKENEKRKDSGLKKVLKEKQAEMQEKKKKMKERRQQYLGKARPEGGEEFEQDEEDEDEDVEEERPVVASPAAAAQRQPVTREPAEGAAPAPTNGNKKKGESQLLSFVIALVIVLLGLFWASRR